MDLENATQFTAGWTLGLRPDAREWLVVVIKATFDLPENEGKPGVAKDQLPLVDSDVYSGEPGFSAPLYESDFAPIKPRCDVVLNGSAYAPPGERATKVSVGLRVGSVSKIFDVIGDRAWEAGVGGIGAGFAKPFDRKEISYNVAFGGTDRYHDDPDQHDACLENPSGLGFRKGLTTGPIDGEPMPNTEERGTPVTSPIGTYRPMSFGPIARSWTPRYKFGGTYDDDWLADVFPFLPEDFDDRYFQCVPEDQQTDYLTGGEEVTLVNLTPDGRRSFRVPKLDIPVHVFRGDEDEVTLEPVADTLLIEPDLSRFSITYRVHLPLKRNLFEINEVIVGRKPPGWWRARKLGKTYYSGLGSVVRERRQAAGGDP